MPATSFDDLYNFEDAFEAAAKGLLVAASVLPTGSIFVQQDTSDIVTPSISLQFSVLGAIERFHLRASDGQPFIAAWRGSLMADVLTDRSVNRSSHSLLRAKIRRVFSQITLWNASELLPWFTPFKVLEAGSAPTTRAEDLDVSSISFDIEFAIRPDAFPASGP